MRYFLAGLTVLALVLISWYAGAHWLASSSEALVVPLAVSHGDDVLDFEVKPSEE